MDGIGDVLDVDIVLRNSLVQNSFAHLFVNRLLCKARLTSRETIVSCVLTSNNCKMNALGKECSIRLEQIDISKVEAHVTPIFDLNFLFLRN